jgi:hypothetical protein
LKALVDGLYEDLDELRATTKALDERLKWQTEYLLESMELFAGWIEFGAGAMYVMGNADVYENLKTRTMGFLKRLVTRV